MKKLKLIALATILILCAAGILAGYFISRDWTIRFRSELDDFFGEGNWERISEETKESIIFTDYIIVHSNPALSGEMPGKFQNWYISFTNRDGEEEIWYITNHVLKINHDRYGIFSPSRYSSKQALTLELMDISFGIIEEEVFRDIVRSVLSEKEAECLEVTMSYHGGNPKPEFYDALADEPWFNVGDISAEHYLSYDLHDFYLYIRAFDYRLEKLTGEEQQNVFDSMEAMEQKLCDRFGEYASFEIYLDADHKVEYKDGAKLQ